MEKHRQYFGQIPIDRIGTFHKVANQVGIEYCDLAYENQDFRINSTVPFRRELVKPGHILVGITATRREKRRLLRKLRG